MRHVKMMTREMRIIEESLEAQRKVKDSSGKMSPIGLYKDI